jgi:GxxExxY protein
MKFDDLSGKVIGFAIEVHRNLGPGLLESAYRMSLAHELSAAGISFQMELPQPLRYKEILLDCGYRLDVLVNRELLIETKSVEALLPIHHAQTLTYMRLAGVSVGLLINFNVIKLQNGIKRFVL